LPIVLASMAAFAVSCSSSNEDETEPSTSRDEPRVYPQHLVPAELSEDRDRIKQFFDRGLVTESTNLNRQLLQKLAEAWGEESVKLVPYHYNFCVCLKAAGAVDLALSETERALEKWPLSFHHSTLRAILLMSQSMKQDGIVEGTREAVESIVRNDRHPLLEALGISPPDVLVQWANVLFRDGRVEASLAALDRAISLAPDSRSARSLRCECLIGISRVAEAIPILEKLVDEENQYRLESMLSHAYSKTGDFEKAWTLIERLRGRLETGKIAAAESLKTERSLAIDGASALNGLGRHAEARDFLLPWLLDSPEDREGLDEIVASLRGLGLAETAAALTCRLGELHAFHYESKKEVSARNSNRTTQSHYHRARAALEIDRLDIAIDASKMAIKNSPQAPQPYLAEAEAYARLGRLKGVGGQLIHVMRLTKSPIIGLCLARVLVRVGNKVEAEALVLAVENNLPPDPKTRAEIKAHALWTRLALGQSENVAKAVSADTDGELERAAPDIVLLCRAEATLASGDADATRAAVSQNFRTLAGGESRSHALRIVLDALERETPDENIDLSALVDQEELATRLRAMPIVAKHVEAIRTVDRALEIVAKRRAILERMGDFSDSDVLPLWRELHELYLSTHVRGKARGLAWFLWGRDRQAFESNVRLATSISRPEEVLPRLAALMRAERTSPGDPHVVEQLRLARAALGISQ
jgi:tetratricopeptide (TPR) repeat protein